MVELLKADPDFANEYLAAALEEADEPGGQTALLAVLGAAGLHLAVMRQNSAHA